MKIQLTLAAISIVASSGCGAPGAANATATSPTQITTAPASAAPRTQAKPIDAAAVERITGGKPETAPDGVVKVSWPRTDVPIEVDGVANLPPFMGVTSWTAFTPGEKPNVEAMVMGDLVLFEDEVNPVMSALLEGGVDVTALHNHFFFDKPHVFFMHVGGEGSVEKLGKAVRAAIDAEKAVRVKAPQPKGSFDAPAITMPSKIDAAKLDALFGAKGQAKDGMYKGTFGRKATASCGCSVGKTMGVNTWAAFAGSDENAIVDGDFAVSESELQPVLKALRAGGINIVAIHHHMTGETPRILFLHYWGRGAAQTLAKTVKQALDLTAWDGKTPTP